MKFLKGIVVGMMAGTMAGTILGVVNDDEIMKLVKCGKKEVKKFGRKFSF